MDLWGVVITNPVGCSRPTVNCKRSNCNKPQKNLESRHVWGVVNRRHSQRVSPFYHVAPYMSSVVDFLLICHELHQESFHCHQDVLDEVLDDGCHCWYCQKGTGLSCRSPDSWWRRLNLVNASLKSERSLAGPNFPDLIERDPPILSVSRVLFFRHSIGEIFLRILVHLDTDFFSSIMFELRFTKFRIFQKAIVDPFKTHLDASLFQIMGNMIVSSFWSFPISMAMMSLLLNDIILNWEKVQCPLNEWRLHFLSRDARKCNKRCLDSSKESILCIALQDLTRTTQRALHCTCPWSSSWSSH